MNYHLKVEWNYIFLVKYGDLCHVNIIFFLPKASKWTLLSTWLQFLCQPVHLGIIWQDELAGKEINYASSSWHDMAR